MRDWELRAFEDVRGQLRVVRRCPPLQLDELRDYLELLQSALMSAKYPDFRTAYLHSSLIRQISQHCLHLCGISPGWLSLPMLEKLLHHTKTESGDFAPGLLVQFNFQTDKDIKKGNKTVGFKEWCAETIASLSSLGLAANLTEAMRMASTIPCDQLDAISQAKLYQTNPKLREKQEMEEAITEVKPEQLSSMLDFSSTQWRDDIDLNDF